MNVDIHITVEIKFKSYENQEKPKIVRLGSFIRYVRIQFIRY
jgi:hypothetical protein